MSFLNDLYQKSLAENETNFRFWEDYLNNLKSLDLNIYASKLKVPALVPIGNRIFFRGEIKHTNEVTVSLGADYFVKCSIQQAEVLRQHRIKDAESKLNTYLKEKEYLENQLSFNKTSLETQGKEIIEYYSEEDDQAWRVKHRENVRKYKQGKKKEEWETKEDISDEELWNRLEELELEEELENEINCKEEDSKVINKSKNSFVIDEASLLLNKNNNMDTSEYNNNSTESTMDDNTKNKIQEKHGPEETFIPTSKLDLLQQVIEKQHELESKLSELKHREKPKSKTESDLIAKLDEMDELDELEDEIDRLDEILQTRGQNAEELEVDISSDKPKIIKLKKSISFADEDDSETLELTFKHSEVEPNNEPYNPERGITKPSDLYTAYSNLFDSKTNSILTKKSKYADNISLPNSEHKLSKKINFKPQFEVPNDEDNVSNKTIVIKDVTEKPVVEEKKFDVSVRPTSLFKKKRMQAKTSFE